MSEERAPELEIETRPCLRISRRAPCGTACSTCARLAELPRDEILVVVCYHGQRSLQVALWLRGQGFARATSLAGGLDTWAAAQAPDMARY